MIGLREYERDLGLPARLGDADLVVPDPGRLLASIRRTLERPDGPKVLAARCTFARWKPGTSITAGFSVTLANGEERHVTWKRYRGDKARHIAASFTPDRYAAGAANLLAPHGVDPEENAVLYAFPVDRILHGLARVLDKRRTSHMIDRAGLFEPWVVRRRASRLHVLRYKPERRALVHLELKLRNDAEGRARRDVIARVLPAEHAARALCQRQEFDAVADLPVPRLLFAESHSGILIEGFLPLGPPPAKPFAEVAAAGELLGRLHGAPAPPKQRSPAPRPRAVLLDLLSDLGKRARRVPEPEPGQTLTWVHGDFHPDQVVRGADGERVFLLDLDELGGGDPRDDLASWIADEIAFGVRGVEDAGEELLEAYSRAGGRVPSRSEITPQIAAALVHRAEAALRRCEADAAARAEALIEAALDLTNEGRGVACRTPVAARLERIAEKFASGAALRLLRIEGDPEGEPVLRMRAEPEGSERVFRVQGESILELRPEDDDALPVSRLLRDRSEPVDELLAWRPGRRITLRTESDRIVKGFRARRAERAQRAHEIAHAAAEGTLLHVPRLLAFDPDAERMDLQRLPGEPLALTSEASEALFRLGHGLRQWQEALLPDELQRHDVAAELEVLDTLARRVAGFFGRTPPGWRRERERLGAVAPGIPFAGPVLTHRDLHDKQVLDASGELGLLDFDLLCAADSALDPANLTAHLRLRALQGVRGATEASADAACEAFLEGLDRGAEPAFHERLRFYQAATFLRLSLVYSLRPPWSHVVPELIELCSRCLDDVRAR